MEAPFHVVMYYFSMYVYRIKKNFSELVSYVLK